MTTGVQASGGSRVRVARIGKPHGLRGEVTVELLTDVPEERFVPGATFTPQGGADRLFCLKTARVHQSCYLLGFDGVGDRSAAEELRGTVLMTVLDSAVKATTEQCGYYERDVLGLDVVLTTGESVGSVSGLHTRLAQDLLEVRRPNGQIVLVPFVDALVPHVDCVGGRVVIDPPPGLLELGV